MRIIWLTFGLGSLMLAGLGVMLPLLPATPFAILATFCFARSSPTLNERLLQSRMFGKAIRDWRTHRAISRRAKVASVLTMALSLAVSLLLAVDPAIVGLQALAISGAGAFILTRNTAA